MTIVAISRELGSGGTAIGSAVAKELGFEFVDREIILRAARAHDVEEAKLEAVDEKRLSFWERFDEEKRRFLIFIEAAFYSFAERGRVVTVGRGGPLLLREVDHALKVRFMAPVEVRVRRIMEEEKLDQRAAANRIRTYDRELAGRMDYLFGVDWTSPDHYDLVLNTGRGAWDFYVGMVVHAARSPAFQPTPASLQKMRDLSLAGQVRAALAADPVTKNMNIEVTAQSGRVALKGVVFSPAMTEAAAAVAERVSGVESVTCEAVEIPKVYPGPIM